MAATTIRLRQTVAMLSTAALVASMTVAIVAAPAGAAKPKCDGKVATIVSKKKVIQGTNGADVIVARGTKNNIIYGKGGRDRICAGGGNDHVYGGSGHDRIFGGSGDDDLFGQTGRDDLFGFAGTDVMLGGAHDDFLNGGAGRDAIDGGPGNDVARGGLGPDSIGGASGDDRLYGQAGNDEINGGDGFDVCVQGQGAGPITACENGLADLSVTVSTPSTVPANAGNNVPIPVTVTVSSYGPDTANYVLTLTEENNSLSDCTDASWNPSVHGPIGPGQAIEHHYTANCLDSYGAGGWIDVTAKVEAQAEDFTPGNDEASSYTTVQ